MVSLPHLLQSMNVSIRTRQKQINLVGSAPILRTTTCFGGTDFKGEISGLNSGCLLVIDEPINHD